jgi:TPR repeat protein
LEAQYQLGMMYLQGEGVTASDEEAMKWLWYAADWSYLQAGEILEYVLNNDFSYGC